MALTIRIPEAPQTVKFSQAKGMDYVGRKILGGRGNRIVGIYSKTMPEPLD